jgi:thioredoxin-like negative regulator of GroEL
MMIAIVIPAQAAIVRVSDENHYNSLKNKQRVLVKFSADWCSVCNGIQKPYEEVAGENEFDDITFVHVDVDKLDTVSKQNGIVGVPTFVYLENGTKKVEEIGVQNMPTFKTHLRDTLRKTFQVAENDKMPEQQSKMDKGTAQETSQAPTDTQKPAMPEESNFVMDILNAIKSSIMFIVKKIQSFFSIIINAIGGFWK